MPAYRILTDENVFVMDEERAGKQDIRPLEIALLNLMPTKTETETQLLRLLSNTPLQVNVRLIKTSTYESKHDRLHIDEFYRTFADIKDQRFDALIITGAPVEHLPFEEVAYWTEICEIMEWSKTNVWSTLHICWGAQAGLYYHYGLNKQNLPKKLSGIYPHNVLKPRHPLMKGFDEIFLVPQSRNAETPYNAIRECKKLKVIADSDDCGAVIVEASIDGKRTRQLFISGHIEYDKDTLSREYRRDKMKGINPEVPHNYFQKNDPSLPPKRTWSAHASLLYFNWLHLIYQEVPFEFTSTHNGDYII
jgi:homoserine O-succinyltransferase